MTSEGKVVILNGRTFKFVELTIEKVVELTRADYERQFGEIKIVDVVNGGEPYEKFKKLWERFCGDVFRKTFFWWVLSPFGYLPRQLRFSSLKMPQIGVVMDGFFALSVDARKQQTEQKSSSKSTT
jgi:hypothetical protein